MPDRQLHSLTLRDYSDRELLFVVNDLGAENEEGLVTSEEVAQEIGITGARANQSVGSRLGWMTTYKVLEHDGRSPRNYRLTDDGRWFLGVRLTARQKKLVDDAGPGEMLLLVREISTSRRAAEISVQHMTRREWSRGLK